MAFKTLLICASALFVQSAVSQYLSRVGGCGCGGVGNALGYGGIGYNGYVGNDIGAAGALGASNGGCLNVVSSSAAPTSLGVASENSYEGTVGVCGNLPLLGTAVVTGEFPTGGLGGINYGCGNGAVGITAEDRAGIGYAGGLGYGSGYGLSYGGYAGNGCGCGGAY